MTKPIKFDPYRSPEERRFATRCRILEMSNEILRWEYEPFTFSIGSGATYKPDFELVYPDHFAFVEVKGSTRTKKLKKSKPYYKEDDMLKLKAAKKFNPEFRFFMAWENGIDNWKFKEIL